MAEEGQPHPERVESVAGTEPDHDWAHGRGYVHASVADVFAAASTPDACVDRREVDRYSFETDVEPGYDVSFRTHNEVDSIITVEFDNTFRFGTVEGSGRDPSLVAGVWQKTYGTTFIPLLRGSIVLSRVADEVTEVQIVYHVRAAERGAGPLEGFVRDYYGSIRALAHGEPLPRY
jgi:hypothetical protein